MTSPTQLLRIHAKTRSGPTKQPQFNVAAAFTLYCRRMSLPEIAEQFGISLPVLTKRARAEDWDGLVSNAGALIAPPPLPGLIEVSAAETEKKKLRIEANREKAFSVSETLRSKIVDALKSIDERTDEFALELKAFLDKLTAGEFEKTSQIQFFVERVETWDNTRVSHILALAKSAKLVDDASMTALGDVVQKGGNLGNGTNAPQLIINLPGIASAPRMVKSVGPAALLTSLPVPGVVPLSAVHQPLQSLDVPQNAVHLEEARENSSGFETPPELDLEAREALDVAVKHLAATPPLSKEPPSVADVEAEIDAVSAKILGAITGEDEAVQSGKGRGCSIDFDKL